MTKAIIHFHNAYLTFTEMSEKEKEALIKIKERGSCVTMNICNACPLRYLGGQDGSSTGICQKMLLGYFKKIQIGHNSIDFIKE